MSISININMYSTIKVAGRFPDDEVWIYENGSILQNTIINLFSEKTIVVFSNPGLFHASYIGSQIPNFEFNYNKIKNFNIDEIYCLVHNDPYVVANYSNIYNIKNIKFICDVNNSLTEKIGYLYDFTSYGLGLRPWPFSCVIKNMIIHKIFYEDLSVMPIDCYGQSSAITLLNYLKSI